jgi:branched-chain amino acid transport system substrate-binding protein
MRLPLIATLFCCALVVPAIAADDPLPLGLITVLTGPQATLGQQVRDGFALGLAERGGKLGGRVVELTTIDDEGKPDIAVNKTRLMLDASHPPVVVGPVFSNILAAVVKPVTESGAVLISPNPGPSTLAGANCNANFYATSYQNDQVHAVMGKVAQDRGYKRVFLLAPNYQAGRDAMAGFKRFYKGEVVDEIYVPLTQMDFQADLARIAAAKPDAVFAFMPGGLGIALVKQYRGAGLTGIPFLSTFTVDESVLPALTDAAVGLNSASNWAPNIDNAENKKFVAAYEAKYGSVPGAYAAQAYDAVALIDSALTATGGDTADKAKLRAALEKADFKSVRGPFRFGINHFPVQDFYLTHVVKRPDGKYQTETENRIFTADVDPYAAQCKMN